MLELHSKTMPSDRRVFIVGVLLVLACSILWGGMHVLTKNVIDIGVSPTEIIIVRQFLSGFIVAIFSVYLWKKSPYKNKIVFNYDADTFITAFARGFAAVLYIYALMYLSATTTIVFYKLSCIFTLLLALLLVKHSPKVVSLALVVVGVLLVTIGAISTVLYQGDMTAAGGAPFFAYVCALLAPLSWAVFAVYAEKNKDTSLNTTDLYVRSAYLSQILILSAFIPLIAHIIMGEESRLIQLIYSYERLIYLLSHVACIGLISGTVAILYFEAVKRISGVLVSALLATEVIATLIFEIIIYDLDIDSYVVFSVVAVMLGIYLISRESGKLRLASQIAERT